MDDERITLRMGTDETSAMDAFLEEHPELGSRSLFIRTAVREYINRDAGVPAKPTGTGVFVKLKKKQLDILSDSADEIGHDSVEEYIRVLLINKISSEEARQRTLERVAMTISEDL